MKILKILGSNSKWFQAEFSKNDKMMKIWGGGQILNFLR